MFFDCFWCFQVYSGGRSRTEVPTGCTELDKTREEYFEGELQRCTGAQPTVGYDHTGGILQVSQGTHKRREIGILVAISNIVLNYIYTCASTYSISHTRYCHKYSLTCHLHPFY